jgi:hypothetical protein
MSHQNQIDAEKQPFLPNGLNAPPAELSLRPKPRFSTAQAEITLITICIGLLTALITLLYAPVYLPSNSPYLPPLQLLGAGLQTSVWAALPAPAILFLLAPTIVDTERLNLARYAIFLGYLVGAATGAGVFGSDLMDAVNAMSNAFAPPSAGSIEVLVV